LIIFLEKYFEHFRAVKDVKNNMEKFIDNFKFYSFSVFLADFFKNKNK